VKTPACQARGADVPTALGLDALGESRKLLLEQLRFWWLQTRPVPRTDSRPGRFAKGKGFRRRKWRRTLPRLRGNIGRGCWQHRLTGAIAAGKGRWPGSKPDPKLL
jgi:hypothetical protein